MVSYTKGSIWNLLFMHVFGVFDKRDMESEACGYGLRETDNTKCIPPSIKPSYKTKSQTVEGRAVEVARGDIRLDKTLPLPLLLWFFPDYSFDE